MKAKQNPGEAKTSEVKGEGEKKYVMAIDYVEVEITSQIRDELSRLVNKAREARPESYQTGLDQIMSMKTMYPKKQGEEWARWYAQEMDMLFALEWCGKTPVKDPQIPLAATALLNEGREMRDSIYCKVQKYSEERRERYKRLRFAFECYLRTCLDEAECFNWDFYEERFFEMDGFYRHSEGHTNVKNDDYVKATDTFLRLSKQKRHKNRESDTPGDAGGLISGAASKAAS